MDSCRWNVACLPYPAPQSLQRRARLGVRSALLKYLQKVPPIDRIDSTKLQIVQFLHIGIHHTGPRKTAKISAAVHQRPVEDPIRFGWIGSDAPRSLDTGRLLRSTDMLPVIISICGCISCGFYEWFEKNRRSADDVSQNPRNDDDQILLSAGVRRRLKPQARLSLLCQEVPAFQFDAQQYFIRGCLAQEHVRKGLRLSDEVIVGIFFVRIPSVADQIQRPHDLFFDRSSEDGIQRVQIRSHDPGNVRFGSKIQRQAGNRLTDVSMKPGMFPAIEIFPCRSAAGLRRAVGRVQADLRNLSAAAA